MRYNLILKDYQTIVKSFCRKNCDFFYDEKNILIVADSNTAKFLPNNLKNLYVFPAGESSKNFEIYKEILNKAFELSLNRDGTFVAFGGGVVCDITGFVASTYMRGAKLIFIPTTLLAMCDAAVGGKTAVDFLGYKNMVGTFYPAKEILIDLKFLMTLNEQEFKNGLGEVLKSAMLSGKNFFNYICKNFNKILARDITTLEKIVEMSLKLKIDIVKSDFRESSKRAYLNFGHTFAHALESISQFKNIGHGEAVVWGIYSALKFALKKDFIKKSYLDNFLYVAEKLNFNLNFNIENRADFLKAMVYDKKNYSDFIAFVLQKNVGKTFLYKVKKEELEDSLCGVLW